MIFYGTTDIGLRRIVNQDNFIIKEFSDEVAVGVVCDGMGGASGGGVASSLAVKSFMNYVDGFSDFLINEYDSKSADEKISDILRSGAESANKAVYEAAAEMNALTGMGTTLVCVLITPKSIYSANVGDSRMYLINPSGIKQITRDHSYVQYLVDIGRISPQKAKKSSHRNIITRAIGTENEVEADVYTIKRRGEETSFALLCTDGLTNMIEPSEIAAVLNKKDKPDADFLKEAAEKFVKLANERGGPDNITVIIISF